MATQVGFAVITDEMLVLSGSMYLATTRRVISVSVMIPAKPPFALVIKAASPRLEASILVTSRIESFDEEMRGFFGRSLETGRLSFSGALGGFIIGVFTKVGATGVFACIGVFVTITGTFIGVWKVG